MARIGEKEMNVSSGVAGAGSFKYGIDVYEDLIDTDNNKGTYRVVFSVRPMKSRYYSTKDDNATFTVTSNNGYSGNANSGLRAATPYVYTETYPGSWVTVYTWNNLSLTHKEDGSLSITVSITYGWASTGSTNYLPKESTITLTCDATTIARNPLVELKVNGIFKKGKVRIKRDGTWKNSKKIFIKVNGVWKESALKG